MDTSSPQSKQVQSPGLVASDINFEESFLSPSAAQRGKPFWSWNGRLDQAELLRQVDVMKAMGMGGAFMHSRTGLQNEYLGDEWFELINQCADKCADLGLEGWIYDEDRWPSGTAGGKVTQGQAHRMRSLVLDVFAAGDRIVWPEREDYIEAHTVVLDELALRRYDSLDYRQIEQCPADHRVLVIRREIHPSNSFYNGGSYLDTLSREATDAFIESTHEKYKQACGDKFGRSIQGIFTDEPHRGFILCDDVQQPGASRASHSIPYTEGLFAAFEAEFGYSLKGRLPELFYQYKGEKISQLKWHYVELLQQLFLRNWAQPCADWCEENQLKLTGHVLHEDSLAAQVVPVGSLLRYYETMSYPGIDVLSKGCESFWIAKQVVSTARQFGKPYVLSELYGATGWDMGFDEHKRIGDWQAFQGVNLRCPHLSWYSMAGESKRDYPASILHQSAWYQEYNYVEDYFARIHLLLSQGEPDCDVLVIHPGESLWAQFHLGWATWLRSDSSVIDLLEEKFVTLYHSLVDAQLDFDYGDEEQMDRVGRIEVIDDEVFFKLGQMRYRSIVVGGMETMRASTLKLLQQFSEAGGNVVFVGEAPTHVDALPSEQPLRLAAELGLTDWEPAALVRSVRDRSEQTLCVNDGAGAPGILSHVRRLENGEVYVALVNTREMPIPHVNLSLELAGQVDRLNCRNGLIENYPVRSNAQGLHWSVDFEPLQEHVFRVRVNQMGRDVSPSVVPAALEQTLALDGLFAYKLNEPNALVLDFATFEYGGVLRSDEATDVLRIDDQIREHLGWPFRTGTMVQPWCRKEAPEVGDDLTLNFSFNIEQMPQALTLVMEQPERWSVELNGVVVEVPADTTWSIDIALRELKLPAGALKVGENSIRISTRLQADTDIEAIYLMGDFGVYRRGEGFSIGSLPDVLCLGSVVDQGLPFYSGEILYQKTLSALEAGQKFRCELTDYAGACVRVELDGQAEQGELLAFEPYSAELQAGTDSPVLCIRVTLTRQNLFGPFHRMPKDDLMTSPVSFRTTGEAYTPAYEFFPSGLISAPLVRF